MFEIDAIKQDVRRFAGPEGSRAYAGRYYLIRDLLHFYGADRLSLLDEDAMRDFAAIIAILAKRFGVQDKKTPDAPQA